jgi:hypothetical protein
VSDCDTFAAMAEGLESVSHVITRYAILDALYFKDHSTAGGQLREAIVRLYVAVLLYLARGSLYYSKITGRKPYVFCVRSEQADFSF